MHTYIIRISTSNQFSKLKFSREISIIIPTLNEEEYLDRLLSRLGDNPEGLEIILVDGGSEDATLDIAKRYGVHIIQTKPGRAHQLNTGADASTKELLWFVHADTLPPVNWREKIEEAIEKGSKSGCFCFEFDENRGVRRVNSYCTRLPLMIFRGGDQSLFATRDLFNRVEGYNEKLEIMEDYEIIKKLRKHTQFEIIKSPIRVSSRKYRENSYFKVNLANLVVFSAFYFGIDTGWLKSWYGSFLSYP